MSSALDLINFQLTSSLFFNSFFYSGYDCSTPICVQAKEFHLNINLDVYSLEEASDMLLDLGEDYQCGAVKCYENVTKKVSNDGRSHQSGCGYDPLDTGCCEFIKTESAYYCYANSTVVEFLDSKNISDSFVDKYGSVMMCASLREYELSGKSQMVSEKYLCNRHKWLQGDFIDAADLENSTGIGADFGLNPGRHTRINYNNYIKVGSLSTGTWQRGPTIAGEGIFECYNSGSCIAPDECSCKDGWSGFDCNTPKCRHKQADGSIVGCLNGGICRDKDDCQCTQTVSILWESYNVERGLTGWTVGSK